MTTEPRPLEPGDRLGQLDIVKVLARTGVASICEARDVGTGDTVAVKWVDRSVPEAVDRLEREYQHLARVRHPNVIAVHQFYFDPRGVLITMELVRGVALGEWLHGPSSGPGHSTSPPPRHDHRSIRHVFHQLALAVAAVHDAGLIHRDINPNHVLVTPEDRVVLIDFWCSREYGPDTPPEPEHMGVVMGNPAYMAPEQTQHLELGPPVDWYAVGTLLYEALTGRRPFESHYVIEALMAKLTERPPRPSELIGSTPRDLDALCMVLLEREPRDRPTADRVLACLA